MHIGDVQCITKILEVELEVILAIEEIMDITCEAARGIKTITMVTERNCLTLQKTNFIYKKVELGSLINKNTIKEELYVDIE